MATSLLAYLKTGQPKTRPLSALTKVVAAAAAVTTVPTSSSPEGLPSPSSSSSSSSPSQSPVTCLESSATTTTITTTTTSVSSRSASKAALSSKKTGTQKTQDVTEAEKKKKIALEMYKRLSSTPAAQSATIETETGEEGYDHGEALPSFLARRSQAKTGQTQTAKKRKAAAAATTTTTKKKKKKNVQDDPKYQAAIGGGVTTTAAAAAAKSKVKEKLEPVPRRRRLAKACDLVETEAEVEDEHGNIVHATAAEEKDEADDDHVVEVAAEEAASVDQTHAVKKFKKETQSSLASLEHMRDTAVMLQERAKQWQAFAVAELKACKSGKDEDREAVKKVADLSDMAKAFNNLLPPSLALGPDESEFRASVIDVLKDSVAISLSTRDVEDKRRNQKTHVLMYMHTYTRSESSEIVKVMAWVSDKDTRVSGFTITWKGRDFPELHWIGLLNTHLPGSEELDHPDLPAYSWQAALNTPYECEPHECAARLFILSHQVGKPFT